MLTFRTGIGIHKRVSSLLALIALTFGLMSASLLSLHDTSLPRLPSQDAVRVPLYFELETGQLDSEIRFSLRHPAGRTFFTPSEVVTSLRTATTGPDGAGSRAPSVLRMGFVNSDPGVQVREGALLPGRVNYLLGNDPSKWRTNLPTYDGIVYESLYPGVDLTYSVGTGQLKGTYVLAPGADPSGISWRYSGASRVEIDERGGLLVTVTDALGRATIASLAEQAPVAWQDVGGERVSVSASYLLRPDGTVGFALEKFDASRPLVIDPTMTYSTYLGGSGNDVATDIAAVSGSGYGSIIVVGYTQSLDFPVENARQPEHGGGTWDIFVTRINAAGNTLMYSTYIGGSGDDMAFDMFRGIVGTHVVWLAGKTTSPDFPLFNPYQNVLRGTSDAFALVLSWDGANLLYSSYFGGSGEDEGRGVEDSDDSVIIVAGKTNSTDLPVQRAFQGQYNGGPSDAFVAGLNIFNATLFYSTYLGGAGEDEVLDLAAEGGGQPIVTGRTTSPLFPVHNAYQSQYAGNGDAFVTRFNFGPTALTLDYSTFLGGGGEDAGYGIVSPGSAVTFVTGKTSSTDFPLVNPFQPQYGGGPSDAFVTHVGSEGDTLTSSSYLGGSGEDEGRDVHEFLYPTFPVYVTGKTNSLDFPILNAVQPQYGGGPSDAFVTRVGPSGLALQYSTYLGGGGEDVGTGVDIFEVDFNRTDYYAYVGGYTQSDNFPLAGTPFQTARAGSSDAFVTKIDPRTLTSTPTPIVTPSATPPASPTQTPPPTSRTPTPTSPPNLTATATATAIAAASATATPTTMATASATAESTTTAVATATACTIQFSDVEPGSTFHPYVMCLACQDILSGYPDGTFRPGNPVTRGQLSKIVSNAAGFNEPVSGQTFEDVLSGSTFYEYIERLASREIIAGYACGGPGEPCGVGNLPYFRPFAGVTRGQTTKIVAIARGLPDPAPGQQTFADVPVGSTFWTWIEALSSAGAIAGYPCGGAGEPCDGESRPYFRPGNGITRGQSAKIVSVTFFPECSAP